MRLDRRPRQVCLLPRKVLLEKTNFCLLDYIYKALRNKSANNVLLRSTDADTRGLSERNFQPLKCA